MAYGRFRSRSGYRRRGNTFRRGARSYMGRRRSFRRRGYRRNPGGLKIEINHKDMSWNFTAPQAVLDSNALKTPTAVTGSAAMTHITEVLRGDSEEERVGGRYKCISLEIKGNITQDSGVVDLEDGTDVYDNHVHLVLVEKKNTQGTQIVPSNVFDNARNPLRVHDQVDDYKVVWHKEVKFSSVKNGQYADATNINWPSEVRDFHMYTKLWQQVDFTNVQTGAITDCRTSSLHLFCWTEYADVSAGEPPVVTDHWPQVIVSLRGRLRFIDC